MITSSGVVTAGERPAAVPRLPVVDIARGVAIVAMVVYHFAWDLSHFRFIEADVVRETGWWLFARTIAGSFLFLAGVSLVLAHGKAFRAVPFTRRLAIIVAAAAAITGATWYVFPQTAITFGILHHIALASVLGLAFLRAPLWLVAAAVVASAVLPAVAATPAFNHPLLAWIGLSTAPPPSSDYVPLFPGFAAVLAGILAARLALRSPGTVARLALPREEAVARGAAFAGRHSLIIYLVHQPLLFGATALAAGLVAGSITAAPAPLAPASDIEAAFVPSCESGCLRTGGNTELCAPLCRCTADRIGAAGLWEEMERSGGQGPVQEKVRDLVDQCGSEILAADPDDGG